MYFAGDVAVDDHSFFIDIPFNDFVFRITFASQQKGSGNKRGVGSVHSDTSEVLDNSRFKHFCLIQNISLPGQITVSKSGTDKVSGSIESELRRIDTGKIFPRDCRFQYPKTFVDSTGTFDSRMPIPCAFPIGIFHFQSGIKTIKEELVYIVFSISNKKFNAVIAVNGSSCLSSIGDQAASRFRILHRSANSKIKFFR